MAKIIRCAIYTRKSTEEGLDQAFNSLDAQREACAAYILSQRHEGWTPVKAVYDDGGFSGGNMERPGLKRLLADVQTGAVDVIVVYKVDRLTRALSDFAKIVDVLDAKGASFVSVTQSFNTTTSMGRLTLNVLLSFAQFEREVTGERIRDKIAASKKKGMWMGGPVPLGYRVQDRKLLIEKTEAIIVRHIFSRYVELGSGRALIEELRADGYRTRVRSRANGPAKGGVPFERGMLFNMLSNRIYRGEIVHKGVAQPGEHEAIIAPELWDQVQQRIAANKVTRASGVNLRAPSLLAGILFDGHDRRMSPSHAVKSGRRYRYYITHAAQLREGEAEAWRLPAHDLEAAIVHRLTTMLTDRLAIRKLLPHGDGVKITAAIKLAATAAAKLSGPYGKRSIVGPLISRITAGEEQIVISVSRNALLRLVGIDTQESDETIQLVAPAVRVRRGKDVKLVLTDNDGSATQTDDSLVALLAEAASARAAVMAAPDMSLKAIATGRKQCGTRLSRLVKLSWLAPEIVAAIADGRHPKRLTPMKLLNYDLPSSWEHQRRLFGIV
jgi:DNA invertase Pin-like site-specific DNA recombinase